MAFTKLEKDMNIIQKLEDEPNDVGGLTAAELKAKFDEPANAVKDWINNTFIPQAEQELKNVMLGQIPDGTVTAGKLADGLGSAPNLLDNWYFADPVDQKKGYVVPPETPYYSDTGLTAQAGSVSEYTKANYENGLYGTVTVGGTAYYVNWEEAVRGYHHGSYWIDRWRGAWTYDTCLIEQGGIRFINGRDGVTFIRQKLENLPGGTYTVSVLVDGISGDGVLMYFAGDNGTALRGVKQIQKGMNTLTVSVKDGETDRLQFTIPKGAWFKLAAIKLERGSEQTLARPDEEGGWVLNDLPFDKGRELLKCQRFYQLFSAAGKRPVALADYRPVLRANPAVGTVKIDGVEYAYADANP